jgi:hypothetical protein
VFVTKFEVPDWMDEYLPFIDTVPEEYKNKDIKKNDVRAALIFQCNSQIRLLIKLKEGGFLK